MTVEREGGKEGGREGGRQGHGRGVVRSDWARPPSDQKMWEEKNLGRAKVGPEAVSPVRDTWRL